MARRRRAKLAYKAFLCPDPGSQPTCTPIRIGISVDHVELQLRTGSDIIALDEEPQFVVSRRREVGPERIHHDTCMAHPPDGGDDVPDVNAHQLATPCYHIGHDRCHEQNEAPRHVMRYVHSAAETQSIGSTSQQGDGVSPN